MDLSRCNCDKAGFCPVFRRDMDDKNHNWCKTTTTKKRENYCFQVAGTSSFSEKIPKKNSELAICTIPADQYSMELLEITRDSIKEYAKKCGADYIELSGDKNPDWSISNKYRVYEVSSRYKKTLYLDCDIIVSKFAPNIFLQTPDDKISAYDEWEIWESKNKTDWITNEQSQIIDELSLDSQTKNSMINGGVLVIPNSLCDFYKEPTKRYPKLWCFDQNYLTLTLPKENFNNLTKKFNCMYTDPYFWELSDKAYFIHVNNLFDNRFRKVFLQKFNADKNNYNGIINTSLIEPIPSHRSGWTYACEALKCYHSDSGIIFDDYIEKTFGLNYDKNIKDKAIPYKTPWVGFVHNPIFMPKWCGENNQIIKIFNKPEFRESLKNCKALFCLSKSYKDIYLQYLGDDFNIPFFDVKLPSEVPELKWKKDLFFENKTIVLNGFWLRKVLPFYLIEASGYKKMWLKGIEKYANSIFRQELKEYQINIDKNIQVDIEDVHSPGFLNNEEYDELLSKSICYVDFYDTVANTAIVDCIARNTPVLCVKNVASTDYLGKDYPLFFEDYKEVESILKDEGRILAAHEQMVKMDKAFLSNENFAKSIIKKIRGITC